MTNDRDFEAWIRARRAGDVPPGFADRVLDSVRREEAVGARTRGVPALFAALARAPRLRAAVIVLGALLFLGRVASLFVLFATP